LLPLADEVADPPPPPPALAFDLAPPLPPLNFTVPVLEAAEPPLPTAPLEPAPPPTATTTVPKREVPPACPIPLEPVGAIPPAPTVTV
jgi:hypothetical protein